MRVPVPFTSSETTERNAALLARFQEQFPHICGNDTMSDVRKFQALIGDLNSHIERLTAPFLSASVLRYQSMLLYASLIFAIVHLFSLPTLPETLLSLPVDGPTKILLTGFITIIAAIFLLGYRVDRQRNRLTNAVAAESTQSIKDYINFLMVKRKVEEEFWARLHNRIWSEYEATNNAVFAVYDSKPSITRDPMAVGRIDLEQTRKLWPDLSESIESKSDFVETISAELDADVARFNAKMFDLELEKAPLREELATLQPAEASDSHQPSLRHLELMQGDRALKQRARDLHRRHIRSWIQAANGVTELIYEHTVRNPGPDVLAMSKDYEQTMARVVAARTRYVALEVGLPVAFAIAALALVWSDGLPA